ncbi:MAG: CsgG/HfaB family protein [Spirochaetota bacterium]
MRLLYTQLILLNALCMVPSLTAEEIRERQNGKITIAVMHIQANNCSETLAMAVKDILSHKLFEAGTFILLERSHVDTLLQKHPESITGRTDPQGMAEIGKILSVQKVVTGSVTSLGKFRIDLRFIDSEKGTIDLSLSRNSRSTADFEHNITRMVDRSRLYYNGYTGVTGRFNVTLQGSFMSPLGVLADGTDSGMGSTMDITFNDFFLNRYPLIASMGFYSLKPSINSIDHFYMIPVSFTAGRPVALSPTTRIIPGAGFGYLISHVRHDTIEVRTYEKYRYSEGFYFNPMITARAGIEIMLGFRWYLAITPAYLLFFESGDTAQMAALHGGLTMLF